MRLNFWLNEGRPPGDSNEVEVVIQSFEFVPLGEPQPAWVTKMTLGANGAIQFVLTGQADRRYDAQGSTNLTGWQTLATLLATNTTFVFTDTNAGNFDRRFYRFVTRP